MTEPIPYLSVCSGIEAFSVAVAELDFKPVAFAEIEDFPSRVLAYRYPDVPNLGDMTAIDVSKLGPVGWLVGGTPCQSFSVAGMRRGLDDDRGNLTLEYVKLAHRLADENGLRGLLWENVPGCLSDKTNAFGCFLGALVGHDGPLEPGPRPRIGRSNTFWRWIKPREKEPVYDDEGQETGEFTIATEGYHRSKWPDLGMVAGPRARAAWRILDSRYFGVPQRRRRVFVVADFGDGPDPAAVLFEPRGQGWRAEAGGEAGEGVAGTISARPTGGGGLGTDMDLAGGLQVGEYFGNAEGGNADAPSLNASNGKGVNNQTALVAVFDHNQVTSKANRSQPADEISHTLPSTVAAPVLFSVTPSNSNRDYSALEKDFAQALSTDGGGGPSARGGDMVVMAAPAPIAFTHGMGSKANGIGAAEEESPTLGQNTPAVAVAIRGRRDGAEVEIGDDQANALRTAGGGSSKGMVMAFSPKASASQSMNLSDVTPSLDKSKEPAIQQGMQVRRLTPIECERLQGFPDGWTMVPGINGWRAVGDDENVSDLIALGLTVKVNKKTGRARVNDPDGPRYKALGNSFTTEPVNWIMSRVQASLRGEPMPDWQPMRLWQRTPQ